MFLEPQNLAGGMNRKAFGLMPTAFLKRRPKKNSNLTMGQPKKGYPYTGYEFDGQKYHDVTYLGEFEDDALPHNDRELLDILKKKLHV